MRTTEARRLAGLDAAGKGFAVQGHLRGASQRVESCRQIVEARQLITFSWCHYFAACRADRPKQNYASTSPQRKLSTTSR